MQWPVPKVTSRVAELRAGNQGVPLMSADLGPTSLSLAQDPRKGAEDVDAATYGEGDGRHDTTDLRVCDGRGRRLVAARRRQPRVPTHEWGRDLRRARRCRGVRECGREPRAAPVCPPADLGDGRGPRRVGCHRARRDRRGGRPHRRPRRGTWAGRSASTTHPGAADLHHVRAGGRCGRRHRAPGKPQTVRREEMIEISKPLVTRLFVGALLTLLVGVLIAVAAVLFALADGVISIGGPSGVTIRTDALAGMVTWLFLAAIVILAGSIAAIASWIAALLNTFRLADKRWFIVLLVLGSASFGWLAMIAYVFAGPDSTKPSAVLAVPART